MIPLPAHIRPLDTFRGARDLPHPEDRLREIRKRAPVFREALLDGDPVLYYGAFPLVRVPYPTRYGLLNACSVPMPLLHILNRVYVVQFRAEGRVRTLLFSPSDVHANRETPFFKRLGRSMGPFEGVGTRLVAPVLATVPEVLARIGLDPADVDYLSYDHLHTQDLRGWLGVGGAPGLFPNAKLLVTRQEWENTQALLPPQRDWYCPGGIEGIDVGRVLLFDGSVKLGDGVALMATPGHTEGNHSLVAHVPGGRLLVTSENGISADSFSPLRSRIPGVAKFAKATGMEVVLNGNTLERGLDQYLSMLQEREVAGPHPEAEGFYDVYPSSELSGYWLFPGISATYSFGDLAFGALQRGGAAASGGAHG